MQIVGHDWALIDARWWTLWKNYSGYSEDESNAEDLVLRIVEPQRPGPIDNCLLLDEHGSLKTGIQRKYDYEFLPSGVWNLLYSWYGGGPAILRPVVGGMGIFATDVDVDLYPITIKVHLQPDESSLVR